MYSEQTENISEKQKLWNAKLQEMDERVDGLEEPMDEGIKETVTALNLFGFPTNASCEGHLDHGSP